MKPIIGVTMHFNDDTLLINNAYVNSIIQAGGIPFCIPYLKQSEIEQVCEKIDGLLLTGGHDINPLNYGEEPHKMIGKSLDERDVFDLNILNAALKNEIPILGISRGHQLLNVAFLGTLIQDIPFEVPTTEVTGFYCPKDNKPLTTCSFLLH